MTPRIPLPAELGAAIAAAGLVLGAVATAPHAAVRPDAPDPSALAAAAAPVRPDAPAGRVIGDDRAVLAIIIDDVGLDGEAAARVLSLPVPVTVSILPYAEDAPRIARAAAAAGHEVFAHIPMEPEGFEDPGPNALYGHLTPDMLRARALWALSRTPGAAGFNNHMGSRLTRSPAAMQAVFQGLAAHNLIYVDSLTHPASVAAEAARAAGLSALRRDVFLDHARDRAAIAGQLEAALDAARRRGYAVMIAHPYPETLQALEAFLADPPADVRAGTAGEAVLLAERSRELQSVRLAGLR